MISIIHRFTQDSIVHDFLRSSESQGLPLLARHKAGLYSYVVWLYDSQDIL